MLCCIVHASSLASMQDNAALQTRNKILEGVVKLNTRHEKRLHCNQVNKRYIHDTTCALSSGCNHAALIFT